MKTQGVNLYIVDDNKLVVADLKHYLQDKFGVSIKITTFNDGESCIEKINQDTDIVILDYFLNGQNGLEVLKLIKEKNSKTEVIMLSSNEDISVAIQTFKNGATDYVVKGHGALKKLSKVIYQIITEPIRLIVKEFRISKFIAVFSLTFVTIGVVVYFVLRTIK